MRIWQISGYYMILYLAGLQTIPDELYEAASLDGANAWQKIRHITVPLLANTTFFVTVLLMIESFNIFEAIMAMTQGGPGGSTNTLLYYIYTEAFQSYRMGYASAMAWVLFFILFVLTLLQFWHRRKSEGARM
jgi:ABC-type sugar transport system permease subunit